MMRSMFTPFRICAALAFLCAASPLLAAPPNVGGCQIFPTNHYWNTPIDQLPVDTVNSTNWVNSIGANTKLHPDWGNVLADNYGIPFSAGPSPIQATITFGNPDESDPSPYRIPPDAQVEGGAGSGGDMHVLSIDTTACKLYELYFATQTSSAAWDASSGAIFDLNSNALRTSGFTSADASGLAIFPGLVRYEEVLAGEIAHAIRFTAPQIWGSTGGNGHKFIWPARHWSGGLNNSALPPMGARFRLKASFNISTFDARTQVILRAFKKYGMVLVDGGSSWYFQGVSDTNWPDVIFSELGNSTNIKGSDFEVVNTALLQIDPNSALAVQVPGAPANVVAVPSSGQAVFTFTAPPNGGSAITTNTITCNPGAKTASAIASPITLTGLTNGVALTCSVTSSNLTGAGSASATVNVAPGQGVLSAVPATVNFGPNSVATSSAMRTIVVTNSGSGNTSVINEVLSGIDAASFSRTSTTCTGVSLTANGTCSVFVTFNPATTGPKTASLTLSGATTSPVTISLSGVGTTVPGAPTIGTPVAGNGQVSIAFTAPVSDGGSPITGYTVSCDAGALPATAPFSPVTVPNLTNGITYTCSVTANNSSGASVPSSTVMVTPLLAATPALIGVVSRKSHGGPTPFDVPIDFNVSQITGPVSVEPRTIGSGHTIYFRFNNTIDTVAGIAVVNGNNVTVGATPAPSGNDVIVTIPSLADNQRVTITLSGVSGPNGSANPPPVSMGFLVGDFNSSRAVNASDISAAKARSGSPVSVSNFKFDVNTSGAISSTDVSAVKARAGLVLP